MEKSVEGDVSYDAYYCIVFPSINSTIDCAVSSFHYLSLEMVFVCILYHQKLCFQQQCNYFLIHLKHILKIL